MVKDLIDTLYTAILIGVILIAASFLYYFRFQLPVLGPVLIRRYYNYGAYEREVQKICEDAKNYFAKIPVAENSLIIFDVDDTALYNLRFRATTDLISPKTTAILPVLELYNYLMSKGFNIVFLTSRDNCERTKEELIKSGYKGFKDVICMREFDDNYTAYWKGKKRKLLAQTYSIVGSIADRERDFVGGNMGHRVKLPNYLYS